MKIEPRPWAVFCDRPTDFVIKCTMTYCSMNLGIFSLSAVNVGTTPWQQVMGGPHFVWESRCMFMFAGFCLICWVCKISWIKDIVCLNYKNSLTLTEKHYRIFELKLCKDACGTDCSTSGTRLRILAPFSGDKEVTHLTIFVVLKLLRDDTDFKEDIF